MQYILHRRVIVMPVGDDKSIPALRRGHFLDQSAFFQSRLNFNWLLFITKTRPCNIQQIFHGCKNDNFQMNKVDISEIAGTRYNRLI